MKSEERYFLGSIEVEQKLLLLCAQMSMSDEQIHLSLDCFGKKPDWESILALAINHNVLPLLYKNIKANFSTLVSSEVSRKLKETYQRIVFRNLCMTGTLVKCLGALQEQGISAVPFKGPILAILYGDLSLRQFADLDILVDSLDVIKAIHVLEGLEYYPPVTLSETQLEKLIKTDNEYPLFHRETGIILDLQWELTGGYFKTTLQLKDLLPHLKPIKILGTEIQTFWDEDLLLYLCIHGNQHVWQRLDYICCVNECLRAIPDLDWDAVVHKAKKMGAFRMLSIGLLLAWEMLDSQHIPGRVLNEIKKDRCTVLLVEKLCRQLFSQCHDQQVVGGVSHRFALHHFKSLDSRWDAVRYAFRLMLLPTRYDWTQTPLPAKWAFLHYIIRPFRVIKKMIGY